MVYICQMNKLVKVFLIVFLFITLSCNKYSICKKPNFHKNYELILSDHHLPVISIVADSWDLFDDSLGIYVKGIGTGENWQGEKANYFSGKKINMNMAYFIHGKNVLEQSGQLKVSGGGSRKQPQKSFNISSEDKFNFKFFKNLPFEEYSNLRLRVSGQDFRKTHLRDALMHCLVSSTNIDIQAYQPSVLYLNGVYWGIYNIREKFNTTYLKQHHNVTSVDILEGNKKIIKGSVNDYDSLLKYVETHDLSQSKNWSWIEQQVDIYNFIDYYCAQIYFANTDWPGNNIKYWKDVNGKWRWFMHDTDLGFGFASIWGHPGGINHNTLLFALNETSSNFKNKPWSTFLFRNFLKNPTFKKLFIKQFHYHLDNTFAPKKVVKLIDSLALNLKPEMPRHINRWKNEAKYSLQSITDWEKELEILKDFARERPSIVKNHIDLYLNNDSLRGS
ncbi:MAG: hypothetical protein CMP65_01490 [Flavobacteriales bacterium]|nr:hypothetical protein [Flavobacteriales bacterium]